MISLVKNARLGILNAACVGVAALILLGIVLLPLTNTTNCGGNTAALAVCHRIYNELQIDAWKREIQFDPRSVGREVWSNLVNHADSHWTAGAGYWLRTSHYDLAQTNEILIFCDRQYGNVPQPTIWNLYRRNPAHAVIRVSGETDLISSRKLAQLDRKDFVLLKPENVKPFIHTP